MKVCLISDACLSQTHGTGAQMLRLFDNQSLDYWHFYFNFAHAETEPSGRSFALADRTWSWRLGARFILRMRKRLGLTWWRGDRIDRVRLDRLCRKNHIHCDVAYVVVGTEESAAKGAVLLDYLGCPFIVHLMDIYYDEGLTPETMPGFQKLFERAAAVLAITPAIQEEVVKFGRMDADLMFIGQEITSMTAQPPQEEQPLRIVMVGRPYREGCELLASAYPDLKARFPNVELLNTGAYFQELPETLKPFVTDCGQMKSQNDYRQLLATCHLAYLSGPTLLDRFGRFSFPSRAADYLMAGLPILACIAPHSATEQVLEPIAPRSVRFVRTPVQFGEAVADFTQSTERWHEASMNAREFAERELSIAPIRNRLFRLLAATSNTVPTFLKAMV